MGPVSVRTKGFPVRPSAHVSAADCFEKKIKFQQNLITFSQINFWEKTMNLVHTNLGEISALPLPPSQPRPLIKENNF